MSPKQQDLHLLKTLMNCNYLITVNWLSGMREYCGCRRACIVLHIRYSATTGCNTLVAQEYQQLPCKVFFGLVYRFHLWFKSYHSYFMLLVR